MRSAHTVEQVREAEEALMAVLPDGVLMQRAAVGLAHAVLAFLGRAYGAQVLVVAGAGNNGGDALWAGAHLARRGVGVDAVLLDPERAHREGLAALRAAGGRVLGDATLARDPDVVLDGVVGIGGRGPLRPAAAAAFAAHPDRPVVAVDVPSGVEVDTGEVTGEHVRAALTVTFGTLQVAHLVDPAAEACGAVELVDIGLDLPQAAVTALGPADVAALLPRPGATAHKYSRGVVGLRTGAGFPGAGVLSASGACCGLAGMVRHVGPAAEAVRSAHPQVVVGAGRVQAWVVGSGSGESAGEDLEAALGDGVPVVVDADALAAWPGMPGLSGMPAPVVGQAVLTPHAGELARMLGVQRSEVEAAPLAHVRRAARHQEAVVLLKGRRTLVAKPDGAVRVNTTGTPWLASAGAGDVLAGLIGALLAAGLDPFDAASVGAWLHGAAAQRLGGPLQADQLGASVRDLIADLEAG